MSGTVGGLSVQEKRDDVERTEGMYVHDELTHGRLTELFDLAEDAILAKGYCEREDVEIYIFKAYIDKVSSYLANCLQYLDAEERCAGESFVTEMCEQLNRRRYLKHRRRMAEQLMAQPRFYFPNFGELLTREYLTTLRVVDDPAKLRFSGTVLFAVAHLPGARSDMRRVLRRKGIDGAEDYFPTLVSDEAMNRRTRAAKGLPPVGTTRKRIAS